MSTDDQFLSNRHPILLLVIVASIMDFNVRKLTLKILRNSLGSSITHCQILSTGQYLQCIAN